MTAEMGVVTEAAPPRPSREQRAAIAFAVGALFALTFLVVVLAGGSGGLDPPIIKLVLITGPIALAAIDLIAAFGLAGRRRWATSVVTPMLQILLLVDSIGVLVALTRGTLQIPIGALLAAWALQARPEDEGAVPFEGPRIPSRGIALAVAFLLAMVVPFGGSLAVRAGSPLLVGKSDLQPDLVVTGACLEPGEAPPGEAPRSVEIAYRWSWARGEPIAGGLDRLMVSWYVNPMDDTVTYALEDSPRTDPAIFAEDSQLFGGESSITYAIDLGARGYADGNVRFTLLQAQPAPIAPVPVVHGSLEVRAVYTHGPHVTVDGVEGLWSHQVEARCAW